MTPPPTRRKRATVHDVAVEAGVSRGTVSRVVNGERYVSAEAREAIEAAIEKVGYVPNTAARNLVMQRTQAVGFVVHEPHSLFVDDPNIGNILLGANEALSQADHQLVCLVVDSERDTDRITRYLSGGFVDGVIMVSARQNDPITRVIERLGLPATFVGHPPDLRELPFVGIDNRAASVDITGELIGAGRRHIGMIAAALDRDSGSDRLAGFRDALGDRFDERLVVEVPLYSHQDGFAGMAELLRREPAVDGVFAASDAVAAGALEALRAAGRSVPEDVSVVGFDDSAWALRCHPPLTTVHQPAAAVGQRAAEVLLAQLRGETISPVGSFVPTSIVRRGSV
ncbi:LacI family DNA-binding transcriptional regulator [Plantibacter sp. MMLR14_011]|uniref:LacI family DNA-binding transcriptional regulator n=1 Tax=Plantibacter sp. MMLR14_011 TaxID=1898746 RepID=UPI0008DDB3B5|nr:LacI family DNA-binding transcriptional regulator [Plantibacter sp. MMLR14_011]OII38723.1 LacI family transcriptional regulator [Plantibacter sp. MMLR14_011]